MEEITEVSSDFGEVIGSDIIDNFNIHGKNGPIASVWIHLQERFRELNVVWDAEIGSKVFAESVQHCIPSSTTNCEEVMYSLRSPVPDLAADYEGHEDKLNIHFTRKDQNAGDFPLTISIAANKAVGFLLNMPSRSIVHSIQRRFPAENIQAINMIEIYSNDYPWRLFEYFAARQTRPMSSCRFRADPEGPSESLLKGIGSFYNDTADEKKTVDPKRFQLAIETSLRVWKYHRQDYRELWNTSDY